MKVHENWLEESGTFEAYVCLWLSLALAAAASAAEAIRACRVSVTVGCRGVLGLKLATTRGLLAPKFVGVSLLPSSDECGENLLPIDGADPSGVGLSPYKSRLAKVLWPGKATRVCHLWPPVSWGIAETRLVSLKLIYKCKVLCTGFLQLFTAGVQIVSRRTSPWYDLFLTKFT